MFEPIGTLNENLTDKIVDQIKSQIITGELKPGDKLPSEHELCEIFQVSRTAVREAVKVLSGLGITRTQRGKGIFVEEMDLSMLFSRMYPIITSSKEDFHDVILVRRILEVEAAGLAAENATTRDIDKMEMVVRGIEEKIETGTITFEELNEANSAFHRLIAKSCGSKVLLYIIQPLWQIIDETRKISLKIPERKMKSVIDHRRILEAIKKQDVELAKSEMRDHLSGITTVV